MPEALCLCRIKYYVLRSTRAADCSVFRDNHCNIQLWARAAHLLQCLGPLSLSPSRDCKIQYQPYDRVIIQIATGEYVAYGQPTGVLKGQVCSLTYELAAT